MARIEITLSGEDFDRLYAIKNLHGRDDLNGNQFAEILLCSTLHLLFPPIPEYDEEGRLLNADKYRASNSRNRPAEAFCPKRRRTAGADHKQP